MTERSEGDYVVLRSVSILASQKLGYLPVLAFIYDAHSGGSLSESSILFTSAIKLNWHS